MYIDSHQHFWYYNPTDFSWIDDSMSILKQNFLPDDLNELVSPLGIEGTVAVQAMASELDTHFLLELAEVNKVVKGVVGWIDLTNKDVSQRLQHYQGNEYLKGFRMVLQDKSPELIYSKDFRRGIRTLSDYNYTYDLLVFPHHLDATIDLVRSFPDQKFVLDHMAKPYIKKGEIDPWSKSMSELSKASDNVYCKVSGLVTEADWKTWNENQIFPYIDVVVEAFGCNRLMYGSDWPVCKLASEYKRVFDMIEDYFDQFSTEEKTDVMRNTALKFYSLE